MRHSVDYISLSVRLCDKDSILMSKLMLQIFLVSNVSWLKWLIRCPEFVEECNFYLTNFTMCRRLTRPCHFPHNFDCYWMEEISKHLTSIFSQNEKKNCSLKFIFYSGEIYSWWDVGKLHCQNLKCSYQKKNK